MLADGFAFDLDGTVYLEDRPLPGARELLGQLGRSGMPYLFATNNSSLPTMRYVARLRAMGIEVEASHVLTSTHAASHKLRQAGFSRAYVLATDEVREELAATGIAHDADDPQAVLLTFDTTIDYGKMRVVSDLVRSGLPYFATHPDLVCPTPDGPIPDCGAFIALFAAATGREPVVLGKPSGIMAAAIRERLEHQAAQAGSQPPARIAFVGDRLYTDVRMANEHGFVAVLTLTGETSRGDMDASPYTPDLVVRDLSELSVRLSFGQVRERTP